MQRIEKVFAGRRLIIETGRMAKQAAGSAVVTFGDTMVLAAVTVSDKGIHVGIRPGRAGEPAHGGLQEARDAAEVQGPGQEPLDGDVVRGDERRRRPRTGHPCLAGDAQGREPRLVRRAEVQATGIDQVGRRGG